MKVDHVGGKRLKKFLRYTVIGCGDLVASFDTADAAVDFADALVKKKLYRWTETFDTDGGGLERIAEFPAKVKAVARVPVSRLDRQLKRNEITQDDYDWAVAKSLL